jgi:predicted Rossmann-fold nucleotide-binding protein
VLLVGSAFWGGLVTWMRTELLGRGLISPGDLDLFRVTDDPDEVVAVCTEAVEEQLESADGHHPDGPMPGRPLGT